MFGSIGWGVTMFIMGIVLDHSKIFQHAQCEMNRGQRNYNVCFAVFSALMFLALVVATQLPFRYTGSPAAVPMYNIQNGQQVRNKIIHKRNVESQEIVIKNNGYRDKRRKQRKLQRTSWRKLKSSHNSSERCQNLSLCSRQWPIWGCSCAWLLHGWWALALASSLRFSSGICRCAIA